MTSRLLPLLLLTVVPAAAADPPLPEDLTSELRPLIERYAADLHSLNRTYPIQISATRHSRLARFLEQEAATLRAVPFESLSRDGQIDYLLLRNAQERLRNTLELQRRQAAELEPVLPFYPVIVGLEEARRKMLRIDPPAVGDQLARLAKDIDSARSRAASLEVKKTVLHRAAVRLGELRESFKDWYEFYSGYDPIFTWWAKNPYQQASDALEDYQRELRQKASDSKGNTIIGDPVGRKSLVDYLAYNMIPYTPEELLTLARHEMAWCEEQMIAAAREMGYGSDWRSALEYVKTRYVNPGEQPELVRRLAEEAIEFVVSRDLVTVPPLAREDWWEEMLSPERQLTSPFFLGGDLILVAFPTDTMTQEQKLMTMRGNNEHFSRSVVFHELIPGHHLQGFMADRYRKYREIFATPFWSEGNAFYWELLLWDLGFPRGPEDRIGMLFWRMHRAARIVFSLSFHMEQMTAQEAVDFLVDRVGFERFNAEAEVRRSVDGSYEPIYQSAYMLGALQFYALHKELVDSGRMTNREFHDAILKENSIPVELIRARLTGQPLTRDYRASWRFYDLP
jgi:hypothetical protein